MRVLAFDPSGNFANGKGISGYAFTKNGILHGVGTIEARNFDSAEAYWVAHKRVIQQHNPEIVVVEDYVLRPPMKGKIQYAPYWSKLETPRLIGVLTTYCYEQGIPAVLQSPQEAKRKWSNDKLVSAGIVERKGKGLYWNGHRLKVSKDHELDAIRHALTYHGKVS